MLTRARVRARQPVVLDVFCCAVCGQGKHSCRKFLQACLLAGVPRAVQVQVQYCTVLYNVLYIDLQHVPTLAAV